jgi:hypothetical protein
MHPALLEATQTLHESVAPSNKKLLLAVKEIVVMETEICLLKLADIKGKQLELRCTVNVIGLISAVEPRRDS